MRVEQITVESKARDAENIAWRGVATHSHFLRGEVLSFDAVKDQALAWCATNNVAAVGLGSPWEPVSAASYRFNEGEGRDAYYGGLVEPEAVMYRREVQALLNDLNSRAGGKTVFYLDNETPKRPQGHLWYFGFSYLVPAWHDNDQDRPVKNWEGETCFELNHLTGGPHVRRPCQEVVAEQRRAGALAVWAHPTSWWFGAGGKFVSNVAAEMLAQLLADGGLDGMTVQGYDACHRSYQRLWFHLLDTGATIPGFAENDTCFDDPKLLGGAGRGVFLNMMLPGEVVANARTGNVFATSGPFVTIAADGVAMGSAIPSSLTTLHQVVVEAHPAPGQDSLSRLEVLGRGGEVLFKLDGFVGGVVRLAISGSNKASYLVARVFGQGDNPESPRQQSIRHMAISNPVYLRPQGFSFKPATTRLRLDIAAASPWAGAAAELRRADGELLDCFKLNGARLDLGLLPASSQLRLLREGAPARTLFVLNENSAVQRHCARLARGGFLEDFPDLEPGEVPPEAFRLEELAEAISHCELKL